MGKAERKMMIGSEGNLDYLLIGDREGTGLGLKALTTANKKWGIIFTVRCRAALLPSATQAEKALMYSGKVDFKTIWPEFIWERSANERVSSMFCVPSGLMPWAYGGLEERMGPAADKIVSLMSETLETEFDHADLKAFLIEGWSEDLEVLKKMLPEKPEEEVTEPVVNYAHALFESKIEADKPLNEMFKEAAEGQKKHKFDVIDGGKSGDFSDTKTPDTGTAHSSTIANTSDHVFEVIKGDHDKG